MRTTRLRSIIRGKTVMNSGRPGASQVLIGSRKRWALLVENTGADDKPLEYHIRNLDLDKLDLIPGGGLQTRGHPKIELHRPSLGHDLLYPGDESIIAIATDAGLSGIRNYRSWT